MAKSQVKKKTKTIKTPTVKYIPNTKALQLIKAKIGYHLAVCIYIGKSCTQEFKQSLFGAYASEDIGCLFIHYKNNPDWATIMRDLGIAKSISQAKGSGWDKEVEHGFQDILLDGLKLVKTDWDKYYNPMGGKLRRITIVQSNKAKGDSNLLSTNLGEK